ncbi:MAG TPA: YidC/Oxa1 family membrane protein insertase [Candidatus Paceibacterota bacterium]|nr:YidC/Oxa1 family membrane protein insertase [Candidatus Paceibacterota bacterium]
MFKLLIYQPLFNLLIIFYNLFNDLGISVILLTALIRLLLWPMFTKNETNQKIMAKIQPEIKRIQKEYAKDYQKQSQELLSIYKQYKLNPSFTIIFSIAQIFIILALYNVFAIVVKPTFTYYLYQPLRATTSINYLFLNTINLQQGSLLLAIIAALTQLVQGFIM